jgi:xylose isomerase
MKQFFENIPKIKYEGPNSNNSLAYHHYNPDEIVNGKKMSEHLKFSVAYWHTLTSDNSDMFGSGTAEKRWNDIKDPLDKAYARFDAMMEFLDKMGLEYFCFHDRDLVDEADTLRETNLRLDKIVSYIKENIKGTDKKVLWGTQNMFTNPRFMHGAATSPNSEIFAYASAQTKKALEISKELGAKGHVFWGGREGYETLLNTDMKKELNNLAYFLEMAVDYAKEIGFDGQFLIEPKPKEPTKHQYDFDVANSYAFLQRYKLDKYFKFNIEANHAQLATHTFQHELNYARINGILGSVDANIGDFFLGWDTDQFATNVYENTFAMIEILKNGGLFSGGLNFDAKVRRSSFEDKDLFYAHIASMDAYAIGLKNAQKIIDSKILENFVNDRYHSYNESIGKKISDREVNFKDLEDYIIDKKNIKLKSGRQELLERMVNDILFT